MSDQTVHYPYSLEADEAVVKSLLRGVQGFAADMRRQGIHVGMGTPPSCVTCGTTWPCQASERESDRSEGSDG